MNGTMSDPILLCVQRIGWNGDTYILPDASFGGEMTEKIHFQAEGMDNLYQVAGTLPEWQEHVGRYCRGNSLLELLASYALTGPLLKLISLEGGGLHLYGGSSTGKTTCALVAGSVCGGGGRRGFIRQWRATHNALESVATQHNDNLLILDEISQAGSETVSQVSYMLANGQGKDRLRSDSSRRKTSQWLLNFLSTGELTINDKILEQGKFTTLAGQEVRVIDLPIDGLEAGNTFQDLHGLPDGSKFSELLASNAIKYYGSPIRTFLEKLCENLEANVAQVVTNIDAFIVEHCPAEASGQVKRVARKIGFTAAVGELAIAFGVLPFEAGAAKKAAGTWFDIWSQRRNGPGDLEIIKAIKRFQDHLAQNPARYINLDSSDPNTPYVFEGYTWKKDGQKFYLMIMPTVERLAGNANRQALKKELDRLGYLAHNREGGVMETKSVYGENKRGWVLIPSAWEGVPSPEDIEEELQRAKDSIEGLFD